MILKRIRGGFVYTVALLTVMLAPYHATASGEDPPEKNHYYKEAEIKASYILNFIEFVTWPNKQNDEYSICVIGDDSVGASLSVLITDSEQENITIEKSTSSSRLDLCDIVFIGESEKGSLKRILYLLNKEPVLIVSDISSFAEKGGIIGFKKIKNTIKIEINKTTATKVGLILSAKLLEVAARVL